MGCGKMKQKSYERLIGVRQVLWSFEYPALWSCTVDIAAIKEYLAQRTCWPLPPLPSAHAANGLVKVTATNGYLGLGLSRGYVWWLQAMIRHGLSVLDGLQTW